MNNTKYIIGGLSVALLGLLYKRQQDQKRKERYGQEWLDWQNEMREDDLESELRKNYRNRKIARNQWDDLDQRDISEANASIKRFMQEQSGF